MAIPWLKLGMWTFVIVIDGFIVFFGLMSASKEASVGEKRMYNAIEAFLLIVLSGVNLRNMYAKYTMAAAKKGPPSLLRKWASRLYRIAMWLVVLAIDVLEICFGLLIEGDHTSDDEKRYYGTWQLILLIALSVLFVVNLYIKSHIATSPEERLPMLAGDMESGSSVTPEPSVSVTTQPNKTSTAEIPVRFESQDMGTCSTE